MAISVQIQCKVTVGGLTADKIYAVGETILLPMPDAVQLTRWGLVTPVTK
jgi:hypothetical protein